MGLFRANFAAAAAVLLLVSGCFTPESEKPIVLAPPPQEEIKIPPSQLVKVQHVLVSFEDKLGGKIIHRTQEEAEKLAQEIMKRADSGESFDGLVEKYTDDQVPGIYTMADYGVDPETLKGGISARSNMAVSFGDVSFSLEVGEVGIAEYDDVKSPYGYHVIKRLN